MRGVLGCRNHYVVALVGENARQVNVVRYCAWAAPRKVCDVSNTARMVSRARCGVHDAMRVMRRA